MEINPQQNIIESESPLPGSSIVPSGVVIPYNAKLYVYYAYVENLDFALSTSSKLNLYYVTGDSVGSDLTLARFLELWSYPSYIYNGCFGTLDLHNRYFYYNSSAPPEVYLYQAGKVEQGDTVLFTWWTNYNSIFAEFPVYDITEIIVNGKLVGWDINFGYYDYCLSEWETNLVISIGIDETIELAVTIEPPVISPGDTANVVIKKKNADGTLEDFPAEQLFEIGMLEGCAAGLIHAGGVDTNYIYGVTQPIFFIAADSLEEESDTVKIRVGLIEQQSTAPTTIGGNVISDNALQRSLQAKKEFIEQAADAEIKEEKLQPKVNNVADENPALILNNPNLIQPENPTNTFCFFGSFVTTEIIKEADVVVEKGYEILLGETKYYQAKYNSLEEELKIEEIKPDANGVPQQKTGTEGDWEWITTDVWGENPVSIDTCSNCGKKMGGYWEKKYPTNQFEDITIGKKKYRIVKMDSLSSGLIRLIGRYWTPDSIYAVNLKARYNNDSTKIKITVMKPTKLGDTYTNTTDVFSVNLNIDSLIIKYSGESGIFPQLTKGQMFQEAKKVGGEFKPSYRYEPFYEVFSIRKDGKTNQYFDPNLPFVVNSTGMGSGDPIPSSHNNVYPIPYPTSPIQIGQFFFNNFDEYKRNNNDGTIKIIGSDNMTKRWNQLYDYYIDTLDYQPNEAKQKAIDTLKLEIRDGLLDTLFLEYAQTRKIASYGFLQILGINPIDNKYYSKTDPTKPPEKINEQDILMPMYVWLINKNLKTSMNNEEILNNWPRGYEAELTRSLYYYNGGIDYAKEVYNNSKDFKPEN